MARRRDALLPAARMADAIYAIAARSGGVCTIGSCTTRPGIVTSVVAECRITLDQRHLDAEALARMLAEAREAAARFAADARVDVSWERLWRIPPAPFDPRLWHRVTPLSQVSRTDVQTLHLFRVEAASNDPTMVALPRPAP